MLLYQLDNSRSLWHVQIDLYRDFAYVPHLHRDFEFVYVLSGELEVSVAERRERAQAGDLALVLPNQVHAYRTPAASQALVCVFSGDYVSAFQREMEGRAGERSVFACPAALDGYLREGFLGVDGRTNSRSWPRFTPYARNTSALCPPRPRRGAATSCSSASCATWRKTIARTSR